MSELMQEPRKDDPDEGGIAGEIDLKLMQGRLKRLELATRPISSWLLFLGVLFVILQFNFVLQLGSMGFMRWPLAMAIAGFDAIVLNVVHDLVRKVNALADLVNSTRRPG